LKTIEELIIGIDMDDDVIFENEYMIVYKVIAEIPTHSPSWVKRIQIVKWKKKKSDKLEVDFRRYSKKSELYAKGISFTSREYLELINALNEYNNEINSFL